MELKSNVVSMEYFLRGYIPFEIYLSCEWYLMSYCTATIKQYLLLIECVPRWFGWQLNPCRSSILLHTSRTEVPIAFEDSNPTRDVIFVPEQTSRKEAFLSASLHTWRNSLEIIPLVEVLPIVSELSKY